MGKVYSYYVHFVITEWFFVELKSDEPRCKIPRGYEAILDSPIDVNVCNSTRIYKDDCDDMNK